MQILHIFMSHLDLTRMEQVFVCVQIRRNSPGRTLTQYTCSNDLIPSITGSSCLEKQFSRREGSEVKNFLVFKNCRRLCCSSDRRSSCSFVEGVSLAAQSAETKPSCHSSTESALLLMLMPTWDIMILLGTH